MKYKTILSFDLSSKCIGVVAARVDSRYYNPQIVKSIPIIPPNFCPTQLGYLKSKKKLPTAKGNEKLNCYAKPGEVTISKSEKTKRDREVRASKNMFVLNYIGKQLSQLIKQINPDIIIVEKNEIFNGVLTSVLLGKVMGVLLGLAAQYDITVIEYKVTKVRSILDVNKITKEFTSSKTASELSEIPDVTKRALRGKMEELYGKYGLSCSTDDESDACVVFHYWLQEQRDYVV